tara:strand:+ start:11030 stop:12892 length:1863 start_codon:yes stop_codon:yes gene_type:complete
MASASNVMKSSSTDAALGTLTTGTNDHPLTAFFGPVEGHHEQLRADSRLSHETYNLPRAYEGKNKYLEEVLDFMIRKEDEFYTARLLPWEFTDELHVAWEIFSFNRTLADLIPHQGLPRFVTQESEQHTDNLLRRGLAFIIEHGFYKTERGKRHFSLNLRQITDAVHTTCYFGVIHALLAGKSYYREWKRKFGRQVSRANDLFQEERKRWAIVQKSRDGLYVLDAEIKHEMKREAVVPTLWVFPDKMGIYVHMVSGGGQLSYKESGPEAIKNRESGDTIQTFRGLPVFEAQSFDVEFTSEPVDLMVRDRQCGEWFYMPQGKNIKIYSADSDRFETIVYNDLVSDGDDENKKNCINATGDDAGRSNGTEARTTVDEEGILLFRPFQTYRMASAILAKGGNDLGSTFHGHHDFMLSDDILRKVHVGHYTFYSKSVVKRPKNYQIVEDVMSQGYIGGEGTDVFTLAQLRDAFSSGEMGRGGQPSIIAVKTNGGQPRDNVLDITGRFHQSIYDQYTNEDTKEHYKGSNIAYEAMVGALIEPYRANPNDEFMQRVKRYNTVCFRGMQYTGQGANTDYKLTHLNTGHWGCNVYAGVRRVRDGENTFMRDCEYKVDESAENITLAKL